MFLDGEGDAIDEGVEDGEMFPEEERNAVGGKGARESSTAEGNGAVGGRGGYGEERTF